MGDRNRSQTGTRTKARTKARTTDTTSTTTHKSIMTVSILKLGFPYIRRSPMALITDRWNQFVSRIQNAIAFIRKAWAWVRILWTAQTAIEGFNHDSEEIVELWLTNHQSAFKPGEIPLIVSALMFLQPDLLRDWLDNYEPGQSSNYTHPEALEEFESDYGSIIRQKQEISENPQSRIPSTGRAN